MSCFQRVGMDVPAAGGDCVCGEFVRFDLVFERTAHFMVCPAVEAAIANGLDGLEIDEDAVKVGMGASNQDHGA